MAGSSVTIACFSGTGNTARVAELLRQAFAGRGCATQVVAIDRRLLANPQQGAGGDVLGLGYPVHAWNAPRIVFDFLRQLPPGEGRPAFIFRTAGDPMLNGGAVAMARRRLVRRGYDVLSDDLFVMPANVAIAYDPRLIKQLDQAAQRLAPRVAARVLAGERHLPHDSWGSQLVSTLFSAGETAGARLWGRHLSASAACTACGRCARDCPTGNITLRDGRPHFAWSCLLCLRCIYSCPTGALRPRIVGRRFIFDHYDIGPAISDPDLPADYLTAASTGMYGRFYAYLWDNRLLPEGPADAGAHGE